ncbi:MULTISPECIES: hypothetical protein [Bacteria]|uniref:hypothetical protein n=1 Tax=Bacteria TaxID=2 RepID=UPI003C7EB33F
MTSEGNVYRRVLRRETHASRTMPAVAMAVVLLLAVIVAGGLTIWASVDVGGREVAERTGAVLGAVLRDPVALAATVAVAALTGVVLILLGLSPGRRARRGRTTEQAALLVDDGVLADAVAAAVAVRCGLARRQVVVTMTRRRAEVRIRPISGLAVDENGAREAASSVISGLGFSVPQTVTILPQGVLS